MSTLSATVTRTPYPDGKVVVPDDERYDSARQAWNLAVDQRPAAVVLPESAADVAAAVRCAAQHGLRVAAQGTGHNAGPLASLADTVLVKTERMRGIRIDPVARTARVEAGVVWLDVVQAAARHGLAALAGSSPDVGVIGYTIGGGMSFLGRKYGDQLPAKAIDAFVRAPGSPRRRVAESCRAAHPAGASPRRTVRARTPHTRRGHGLGSSRRLRARPGCPGPQRSRTGHAAVSEHPTG